MESLKQINQEIADALEEAFANVDEETGEINSSRLDELNMKREEKLGNIVRWEVSQKAVVKAIDEEISRLKKMKERAEKQVDWIENFYLPGQLEEDEKFTCPDGCIRWARSKAVNVLNIDELPAEYIRIKQTVTADKAKLLKDLKEGKEIAGAVIEERRKVQVK